MVSRRQIKHAIDILSQACDEDFLELKQEIQTSVSIAKKILLESEFKLQQLSKDQGKSQSIFGFTSDYVANIKHNHNEITKKFIENWCVRQSDWRFPWCFICANHSDYVHLAVKSHLVYVCSNHLTEKQIKENTKKKLSNFVTSNPRMFRVKPLQFTGHISDHDVPHTQIGTAVVLDFIPYLSLEQIKNLLESINNLLRQGGQALVHFSDCDGEKEWQSLIDHKITICNQSIIEQIAGNLNLACDFFHVDDFYSFVVLTKPGHKTSIKSSMTKIEPIT